MGEIRVFDPLKAAHRSDAPDPPVSVFITLTKEEQERARITGTERTTESRRLNLEHEELLGSGLSTDIEAAGAEIAAARALGRYWYGGVNAFSDADVSPDIEVRWTPHPNGGLIIRPGDEEKGKLDRPFVLVRGSLPDYEVVGWIYGFMAKRPGWRRNPARGRECQGPCWIVPAAELWPVA